MTVLTELAAARFAAMEPRAMEAAARAAHTATLADEERARQRYAAPQVQIGGGIAVIPVRGMLTQRSNRLTEFLGGTSTEVVVGLVREAVADESVGAIVLDVNSPGGTVWGIPEAADALYAMRGSKPIVAVANAMMASGAYWLASQADELVVTPSGEVGSIGVRMMHQAIHRMAEDMGVDITEIAAGRKKLQGTPFQPLSEEDLADFQAEVDTLYGMFISAVARGRGASAAAVRTGYGEGAMILAREAQRQGMVDRVATLDQTIARLVRQRGSGRRRSAMVAGLDVPEAAEPPTEGPLVPAEAQAEADEFQPPDEGTAAAGGPDYERDRDEAWLLAQQ